MVSTLENNIFQSLTMYKISARNQQKSVVKTFLDLDFLCSFSRILFEIQVSFKDIKKLLRLSLKVSGIVQVQFILAKMPT